MSPRRLSIPSAAQPGINRQPQTTQPPQSGGPRKPLSIRDLTRPSHSEQQMAQMLDSVLEITDRLDLTLRAFLEAQVQTLDTVVYEHETIQLPTAADVVTLDLPPQTVQQELITGLFVGINIPDLTVTPDITVNNAWVQLGDQYVNLTALFNESGTGGMLPGNFAFILNADSKRRISIAAASDFPAESRLSFALFGTTVPATLGEVLH